MQEIEREAMRLARRAVRLKRPFYIASAVTRTARAAVAKYPWFTEHAAEVVLLRQELTADLNAELLAP